MSILHIEPKVFKEALEITLQAGRIIFKNDLNPSHDDNAIEETIALKLAEKYKEHGGKFSKTSFRNFRNAVETAIDDKDETHSVQRKIITTIILFLEDKSHIRLLNAKLKNEVSLLLAKLVIDLDFSQNKKSDDLGSDPLPDYLFGVYKGYFLRPYKEKPENHIAMLIVYIDDNSDVSVKSAKIRNYEKGRIVYQKKDKILVCKFEGTNNSATHIFQFSLTHDDKTFKRKSFLRGIYGGTDPMDTLPICGKIILERLVAKDNNWEQVYQNTDPENFESEGPIAELFNKNHDIFNFLKSNDFIEDINFFKNYSIANDLLHINIAGVYTIYSLFSDEFQISIGVIKIGRLGDVEIKGNDDTIYKGVAKVFARGILSINVHEKTVKEESPVDYYFNYLVKVIWGKNERTGHPFLHGVRTIVAENLEIDRPSAARVIFKKEERDYDKISFQRISVLPYEWNKHLTKVLSYKNMKSHKLYKGSDKFINDAIKYLIGDANNLLIAKSTKEDDFNKFENYALVYFNAALNYANKGNESEAKKNFERAFSHGFYGTQYLTVLNKEKENSYLSKKGKEIVNKVNHIILNKEPYFFFDNKEGK